MKQIKELREVLGYSQSSLAKKWEIARQTVSQFEQVKTLPPSIKILIGMLAELPPEEQVNFIAKLNASPWRKPKKKFRSS